MADLLSLLQDAEKRWVPIVCPFCEAKFNQCHLSSHNHLHHLRTWLRARELFEALYGAGVDIVASDVEASLIAVFFHDVGMTVTLGERHGCESKKICESFFRSHPSFRLDDMTAVFTAVEQHDNKEYKSAVYRRKIGIKNPLSILSVSDDLDAFGAIGVFRYAEIYLARGVVIPELSERVLINLESRYDNFFRLYSDIGAIVDVHSLRYAITQRFYRDLAKQIKNGMYSQTCLSGPGGVLNLLTRYLRDEQVPLSEVHDLSFTDTQDDYVVEFFRELATEIASSPSGCCDFMHRWTLSRS